MSMKANDEAAKVQTGISGNGKGKGAKEHLLKLAVSVVLLVALIGVGNVAGIFEGMSGLTDIISLDPKVVIQLLIMIALVMFVESLFLMVLNLLKEKDGRTGTLAAVFSSVVKYVSILIMFCWGMTILGVNVSTVFASVGIVALILGFGAESLVADLVTGVFVLFENQFNKGDIIEVGGYRGTVKEIGIRTISVVDSGGNVKIINHSALTNVINRSEQGSVSVCEVGVTYEMDLDEVEAQLPAMFAQIKEKHSEVFVGDIRYVGVDALADSAVVLKIVADVKEADIFKGKRILNKEIKCAFDRAGITIAYPQLDIHMKG